MNAQFKPTSETIQDAVLLAISRLSHDHPAVIAGWDQLDLLSSGTTFEGIEGAPGGVVVNSDGRFEAAATVYVTLNFGGSRDAVSMSDAYPAMIKGHIEEDGSVEIERFEPDTNSFYED